MSEESKKAHSRIRTFAGDLDEQRKKRAGKEEPKPIDTPHKFSSPSPKHQEQNDKKPAPVVEKEAKLVAKPQNAVKTPLPEPKKEKPRPDTKIPAFHELQKKAILKHKEEERAKSVVVERKNGSKTSIPKKPRPIHLGSDSMIIRDTKITRIKFIPSVVASIKNWFKNLSNKRKRRSIPTYNVPETDRRKGVIQKATSKTGTLFTADNETLKEQIRLRQRSGRAQTEEVEYETNWSPYTETGYNLLEAPEETEISDVPRWDSDTNNSVSLEFKKLTREIPSEQKPIQVVVPSKQTELVPEPVEKVEEEPEAAEEEVEKPEPIAKTEEPVEDETMEVVEEETKPEEVVEEEPVIEPEPEEVIGKAPEEIYLNVKDTTPSDEEVPSAQIETNELPTRQMQRSGRGATGLIHQYDTNTLTVSILVTVIGLVIVLLTARMVFHVIQGNFSSSAKSTLNVVKPVLQETELVTIKLNAENINQLPQLIQTAVTSAPAGIVELPVVSPDGNNVSPSYLFEALNFRAQPSLQQSITVARFVTIDQSDPILVIQFIDKNTVLGGLLNWEETMADDMRVLYTIPNDTSVRFTDEIILGVDVRTLRRNSEGNEVVLVYGFTGEGTLLVAANLTDFTKILQAQ